MLELLSGDLRKHLLDMSNRGIIASSCLDDLLNACRQAASAVAHLARHGVIHRDIAARNVLVGSEGLKAVKLSDLGLSRTLMDSPYYHKTSNDKVPVK